MTVNEAVVYFFVYSFLGWIYESVLVSLREKTWSNRGFLIGPICPIYGVGAILCVLICSNTNIWISFILCMLGSAVLEYTTAYTLEKLFHASWWDYSNIPFNIKGYICLPASLAFGVAGVVISHFIHPIIAIPTKFIPAEVMNILALILVSICSADLTLTVSSLSDFAERIKTFDKNVNKAISAKYDELENTVSDKLATVKHRTLLTDAAKNSIIEQEIQKANIRLNRIQRTAVQGIRRFSNDSKSGNLRNIHELILSISSKAKKHNKKNESNK